MSLVWIDRKRALVILLAAGTLLLAGCSGANSPAPVVSFAPTTTSPGTTSSTTGPPITAPTTTTSTTVAAAVIDIPEGAVPVTAAEDLSRIVAAAEEGTVFLLEAGIHRMQSIVPKDGMSFLGEEGTVMNGSLVLEGFVADGNLWRIDDVPVTGSNHGRCIDGYDGCTFSQDLFMDNVMLWQVTDASDLEPGRWLRNGDSILVVDDPAARVVELSMSSYAFVGSADDVSIRGLKIEKYATPAQEGAVQAQDPQEGDRGDRWLIEDIEVTGIHGVGVRTGDGTIVRNSSLHHNGQMGITASGGVDVLIEGNEIAYNNIAGFDWEWEAGGGKFTETVGLVVRDNYAHDNDGPGLWTDIDARDTHYEGNVVTDNSGPGIFHEISFAVEIRDNTVTGNGFGKSDWLWGAGILIAASSDVVVMGNDVAGNADGIAGIQQDRGAGAFGAYLLQNLAVDGNTISMDEGHTGIVADTRDDDVFVDRDLSFANNTYVDVVGIRFAWAGQLLDEEGWRATGQGMGSVWL
ncbi:MAG: right-handed parallel beta-helix repeat-containing protein [Actinomycetota bacterium]|nr:right-handed parallel beta-helix repeat-containing protein [Actinomycetota bacterium]